METTVNQSEIIDTIESALESIRPFLQADGGNVQLMGVDPDNVVRIKLLGACKSCDISHITMKAGIEDSIRKVFPALKSVVAEN